MSALSDIVANLESGGGANAANQPASMANPVYGQYPQFVSQYGSGAAGVDAYAQQVLAANPNATLGDFYSGYAINTGNPANTPGLAALQTQYPAYYNNLVNNAGVDVNTPLASLVNSSSETSDAINGVPLDSSSGLAAGNSSYVDPNNINALDQTAGNQLNTPALDASGYPTQTQAQTPSGSSTSGSASSCNAGNMIVDTLTFGITGSCDVGTAITKSFTAIIQGVESWFTRGFLILIGVVFAAIAIILMTTKQGEKLLPKGV